MGILPKINLWKTTIKEAKSLYDDGIPVTPLPWVDRKTN